MTSSVWIALAFVVVGALLFAWGVVAHLGGLILLGVISIAIAAIYGSKGHLPHHGAH
jgi:4-hydroxybenzoate polyprenyltransferase